MGHHFLTYRGRGVRANDFIHRTWAALLVHLSDTPPPAIKAAIAEELAMNAGGVGFLDLDHLLATPSDRAWAHAASQRALAWAQSRDPLPFSEIDAAWITAGGHTQIAPDPATIGIDAPARDWWLETFENLTALIAETPPKPGPGTSHHDIRDMANLRPIKR
jgi:hypothetical protein